MYANLNTAAEIIMMYIRVIKNCLKIEKHNNVVKFLYERRVI